MATRFAQHYPIGDTPADRSRRLQQQRHEYDRDRRLDPVYRFYSSAEWRILRSKFRKRFPYCRECGAVATQIDHIEPVRKNWARRLDPSNLQSLCSSCHSRKTAYDGFAGNNRK